MNQTMPKLESIQTPKHRKHRNPAMLEAFGESLQNPNSKRGKLYWLVQRTLDGIKKAAEARETRRIAHAENR